MNKVFTSFSIKVFIIKGITGREFFTESEKYFLMWIQLTIFTINLEFTELGPSKNSGASSQGSESRGKEQTR